MPCCLLPLRPPDARQRFIWRADAEGWPPLDLPGVGQLRMQETMGTGLRAEALAGAVLIVQFRQGGERFRPIDRAHSQELKKLLQEAGIPPWERERWPLVYLPNPPLRGGGRSELLAVVGLGVAADFATGPGKVGCSQFSSRYQRRGLVSCNVFFHPLIWHDPIHLHHRRCCFLLGQGHCRRVAGGGAGSSGPQGHADQARPLYQRRSRHHESLSAW